MKKLLMCLLAGAALFSSCKQDAPASGKEAGAVRAEKLNELAGDWIALDFCSRADQYGSVLGAMNNAHLPYAYAFSFDVAFPDSVRCFNGIEEWLRPIEIDNDTIEIKEAVPGRSVFLVYHSQEEKNMTMFDGTGGKMNMHNFIKSKAGARSGYAAFQTALNHNLFSGVFTLAGNGATGPVQFTPGGFIMNMKDWDRYEVCTRGDCFVAGDEIDVVTFSNSRKEGSARMFGFRYDGQNENLSIYNLAPTNPNEKSVYAVKGLAYQFSRKKPQ